MRRDNPRNRNNKKRKRKYGSDIDHEKAGKGLSISIAVLVIIFIIVAIFYYIQNTESYKNLIESAKQDFNEEEKKIEEESEKIEEPKEEEPTDSTFTLAAIGDVMCHNTQYMDAYNAETGEYDFSYVFENTNLYTKTADITVANLETSFAGADRGYSNYPTFNSPDALAYSLKNIGVDVISTAGNHCLDMGFDGLSRTIDILDDADIAHVGTYKTQEDQNKVIYKYIKGVKIAFINYTYGTNGIPVPTDKPFCVNLIDKDLIKKHIEACKAEKADMIVACMHWGTEYKTVANSEQEELADFLFQNGVDVILGNHPHVLENMEKRTVTLEDGTTKDGFVIYALGNFICDQNAENTRNSIILNLTITKHVDGTISIDKVDYVPIYMYKDTSTKTRGMKLIDITKAMDDYESFVDTSIGEKLYNTLKTQLNKIISIVGTPPSSLPSSMVDYGF